MDYPCSLYDALVSINVPNDEARAVVDAMERDMGTTVATKSDLQLLRQEMAFLATKAEVADALHSTPPAAARAGGTAAQGAETPS